MHSFYQTTDDRCKPSLKRIRNSPSIVHLKSYWLKGPATTNFVGFLSLVGWCPKTSYYRDTVPWGLWASLFLMEVPHLICWKRVVTTPGLKDFRLWVKLDFQTIYLIKEGYKSNLFIHMHGILLIVTICLLSALGGSYFHFSPSPNRSLDSFLQ